ncbi:MAG: NUDIX hydrolase [bacterium]|jgi:8-oxo-dGTP diphosphatase
MAYSYTYPRASLTVDAAVFKKTGQQLEILLIQRKHDPYQGKWALPGGFMDMDETLEQAVHRELEEETGLKSISLEQLHAFSTLDRDPRGRTVSVVFWSLLEDDSALKPGDDARDASWFSMSNLPALAFDHQEIIQMAFERAKMHVSSI